MPDTSPPKFDHAAALTLARRVLSIEASAVEALGNRLDSSFTAAMTLILACRGRVVVSGMGKSGHVGNKIAATLASTGTPAFFVHPGEASHGDLGMITAEDVCIALSNSGESAELTSIVPLIKRRGARLISMTGNPNSTLAREADVHLDASVAQGGLPAQPRSDRQHHRGTGTGRCAARSLCWRHAVSVPTTSHAPTPAVRWDASCWCMCAM